MRVLLQRVTRASVSVEGTEVAVIGPGLLLLVGFTPGDGEAEQAWMADKVVNLRIFEDEAGKLNRSVLEAGGQLLAVSQFTLYADSRKGRRPSFDGAAPPETARALFDQFVATLRTRGIPIETGVFQAHMQVALVNDGPVTIWLDWPPGGKPEVGAVS